MAGLCLELSPCLAHDLVMLRAASRMASPAAQEAQGAFNPRRSTSTRFAVISRIYDRL